MYLVKRIQEPPEIGGVFPKRVAYGDQIGRYYGSCRFEGCPVPFGPKLKPRWDVHLSGDDDQPVNPSHPFLENDPAPSFDPHHLRISPWL